MNKLCILGLGYIGLPTAAMFASHGFEVIGVDVNGHVVEVLNNGDVHIREAGLKTLVLAARQSGKLRVAKAPEPRADHGTGQRPERANALRSTSRQLIRGSRPTSPGGARPWRHLCTAYCCAVPKRTVSLAMLKESFGQTMRLWRGLYPLLARR
ncbi:MAG: hypothetical protein ACUVX9_06175 [Anaerolineae bacterium]